MPLKFSLNPYLEDRDGVLYIDGVSSLELVDKFDTPLYVLAERRVRIYYSAKANTGLSVLKILESEGSYLDAVSPGEVFLALKAGFTSDRILFTGTSVRNDELRYLVDSGVTINIDSLSQLRRLLKIHVPEVLSVRVNPEIGAGHHEHCITAGRNSKFGIWDAAVVKAYRYAKNAGVKRFGMQMHIGSGILTIEPFLLAAEKLLNIAYHIREELDVRFDFVDLGGGIGVPYKPEEKPLDIDLYAENLIKLYVERINEYDLGEPWFCIEPGRYIICDAGILLTLVNTVKTTPFKKFVGVDAGFNTLIRPAMYGSYHPIIVANKLRSKDEEVYDIAGPLCESGDLLATDRKLPKISEGDLLAILNAGAYGFSMSSNYNSRPRCGEVLVKDGEYALVRRREHLEDLLRGQEIPSWLR